jgi:hypothetical protein
LDKIPSTIVNNKSHQLYFHGYATTKDQKLEGLWRPSCVGFEKIKNYDVRSNIHRGEDGRKGLSNDAGMAV